MMAMVIVNSWAQRVDQAIGEHELVQAIGKQAEKFSIPRRFVSLGIVGILVGFLLFGLGPSVVSTFAGFIYPAWQSFKVLQVTTEDSTQFALQRRWLYYWVVYASFSMVEIFADYILFFIPFYFYAKLAFLLFIMNPQLNGAEKVYTTVIQPILVKYQPTIEKWIGTIESHTFNVVDNIRHAVVNKPSTQPASRVDTSSLFGDRTNQPQQRPVVTGKSE